MFRLEKAPAIDPPKLHPFQTLRKFHYARKPERAYFDPHMGYKAELVAPLQIEHAILLIRAQRVLLDRDLAAMDGVTTGNLNKAVRRNRLADEF